jgi:hypothetical protein
MFGEARANNGPSKVANLCNANTLAERQPQVQEELGRLNSTLEGLYSTVDRLEQRLQSVILPRPEEVTKSIGQPEETTCSVAGALRNLRRGVESISQRLYTLMTSLEI